MISFLSFTTLFVRLASHTGVMPIFVRFKIHTYVFVLLLWCMNTRDKFCLDWRGLMTLIEICLLLGCIWQHVVASNDIRHVKNFTL